MALHNASVEAGDTVSVVTHYRRITEVRVVGHSREGHVWVRGGDGSGFVLYYADQGIYWLPGRKRAVGPQLLAAYALATSLPPSQ